MVSGNATNNDRGELVIYMHTVAHTQTARASQTTILTHTRKHTHVTQTHTNARTRVPAASVHTARTHTAHTHNTTLFAVAVSVDGARRTVRSIVDQYQFHEKTV